MECRVGVGLRLDPHPSPQPPSFSQFWEKEGGECAAAEPGLDGTFFAAETIVEQVDGFP